MRHPGKGTEVRVLEVMRHRDRFSGLQRIVQADFFTHQSTRRIYEAITRHFGASKAPKAKLSDLWASLKINVTDDQDLDECKEILNEMKSAGPTIDPDATRSIALDFVKKSLAKETFLSGIDSINDPERFNLRQIRDQVEHVYRLGIDEHNGYDYLATFEARRSQSTTIAPIPTNLPTIDLCLEGGLDKGEIGVIIGPTHRGKTRALCNLGWSALKEGKHVVHLIVCDSTASRIARRYDCLLANLGFAEIKEQADKAQRALRKITELGAKLTLKEFDKTIPSPNDVRMYLQHYLEENERLDLVIVDYMDEMKGDRMYKEYRFESRDVTSSLRRVAAEYACPLWTASQGNRGSFSKREVNLDDVAEDIWKVNAADVVITLNQNDEEAQEKVIRYKLAKARRESFIPTIIYCDISPGGRVEEVAIGNP